MKTYNLKMLFLLSNTTKMRIQVRFCFFSKIMIHSFSAKNNFYLKNHWRKTFVAKVRHKKVKGILVIWVSDQKCVSVYLLCIFMSCLIEKCWKRPIKNEETTIDCFISRKMPFFRPYHTRGGGTRYVLSHLFWGKSRGNDIVIFVLRQSLFTVCSRKDRKWLFTIKSG
jgi:hypothetical protein